MNGAGIVCQIAGILGSEDGPTWRRRLRGLLWIGLIVGTALIAVAVYWSWSRRITNPDPFVYGIAAKRLLAGERLYIDFFESKPPLATLFYAIPGALWPRSYLAVCWFLAALLMLQGLLWVWWFRPRLATGAVCLWFVVLYPATFRDFAWFSTEHMSNLFLTVVLLASVATLRDHRLPWWRYAVAGAATAAAFHCRQNAVLCVLVPLAIAGLIEQPLRAKLQAAAWLVLGGVTAWAAIFGVACLVSDPENYLFQVFVFPRRFALVGGRVERFSLVSTMGNHSLPVLLGLAAGLGLIGPHRRLVLIVVPVAMLMCLAPPRAHYHYWANLLPFVTVLLLVGLPRNHPRTPYLELVALAAFSASIFTGLLETIPMALSPAETEPMAEVAAWIDGHASPSDTLYVFGPMNSEYVQFRSRLRPANKYTVGWELDMNKGMMADSFEEIVRSYLRHPPTIFVIHDSKLAEMKEAKSRSPEEIPQSIRLGLELMDGYRYDHVKELNGFEIHVLRGAADYREAHSERRARPRRVQATSA